MAYTLEDLNQFSGCDQLFRHNLVRKINYTEGVQFMAEHFGAYWLLDIVATNQLEPKIKAEPFQCWDFVVNGTSGVLSATDGDDKVIFREDITFTDFPAPGVKLYCTDNTILLPGEY